MTTENKSTNQEVLEEMNRPLNEIEAYDAETLKEFESKSYDLSLLYGPYEDNPRSTYAVKATSKLGKHESAVYLYVDFTKKKCNEIQEEMDDFGYMVKGEFEKMKAYAEYLKIHDKFEAVDNLDVLVAGYDTKIAAYEEAIRDFVLENSESITKKSAHDYQDDKHNGAWLDEPTQINKYGETVFALVNSKLREILDVTDTTKLGKIKSQMVRDGFLINKEPKDITLSTGNEKKCSLFRISPSEQ